MLQVVWVLEVVVDLVLGLDWRQEKPWDLMVDQLNLELKVPSYLVEVEVQLKLEVEVPSYQVEVVVRLNQEEEMVEEASSFLVKVVDPLIFEELQWEIWFSLDFVSVS